MKRLIVGGNFGKQPKRSSIVSKLGNHLFANQYNGGSVIDLINHANDIKNFDLTIWMPNVDNTEDKIYPKKRKGSILIVTKVLRNDNDSAIGDAVSRIFRMQGNAVIAISSAEKPFKFSLIDALGNVWCSTTKLPELTKAVESFAEWTSGQVRVASIANDKWVDTKPDATCMKDFCNIVKTVANKVEAERGGRYFGNASTRCSAMFPSKRKEFSNFTKANNVCHDFKNNPHIYVSGRNTPKDFIRPDDFILAYEIDELIHFHGNRKPSVDTPVQLALYREFDTMNYMIHGHAYIKGKPTTQKYFPCGDMREFDEIKNMVNSEACNNPLGFAINLKNHGFLIAATSLKELKRIVENETFEYKSITC